MNLNNESGSNNSYNIQHINQSPEKSSLNQSNLVPNDQLHPIMNNAVLISSFDQESKDNDSMKNQLSSQSQSHEIDYSHYQYQQQHEYPSSDDPSQQVLIHNPHTNNHNHQYQSHRLYPTSMSDEELRIRSIQSFRSLFEEIQSILVADNNGNFLPSLGILTAETLNSLTSAGPTQHDNNVSQSEASLNNHDPNHDLLSHHQWDLVHLILPAIEAVTNGLNLHDDSPHIHHIHDQQLHHHHHLHENHSYYDVPHDHSVEENGKLFLYSFCYYYLLFLFFYIVLFIFFILGRLSDGSSYHDSPTMSGSDEPSSKRQKKLPLTSFQQNSGDELNQQNLSMTTPNVLTSYHHHNNLHHSQQQQHQPITINTTRLITPDDEHSITASALAATQVLYNTPTHSNTLISQTTSTSNQYDKRNNHIHHSPSSSNSFHPNSNSNPVFGPSGNSSNIISSDNRRNRHVQLLSKDMIGQNLSHHETGTGLLHSNNNRSINDPVMIAAAARNHHFLQQQQHHHHQQLQQQVHTQPIHMIYQPSNLISVSHQDNQTLSMNLPTEIVGINHNDSNSNNNTNNNVQNTNNGNNGNDDFATLHQSNGDLYDVAMI